MAKRPTITLTEEQFGQIFTYLDREHRLVGDPNYHRETVALGMKVWDMVRDIATEHDFSPPQDESKAAPAALRPSSWEYQPQSAAKSRSSSRRAK